ncbi:cache domain-containing sensor histidine kinase [Bacillus sp. NPDC077027]|uniref:cache domain-containing sensor histidine kinase n=1 Tax=Bacillus sp. NPDC077027 TaxID=3390548 RepID=UPI003D064433
MKRAMTRWITYYQHLSIKDKLFLFLCGIMLVSFLFVYSGVQYAFHVYDEQYYRKSSQVLAMSSKRIEDELRKIEEVSYEMMTDRNIQEHLENIEQGDNRYSQYQTKKELWDKLASYAGSEKYIESIHLFDKEGTEYAAGRNSSVRLRQETSAFFEEAIRRQGKNVFIPFSYEEKQVLVSARQIRSYDQLSLLPLGTLLIQIDLERIVADLPKEWADMGGELFITSGQRIVLGKHHKVNGSLLQSGVNEHSGYEIRKENGRQYFISFVTSTYQPWAYVNVVPFDHIFTHISWMKTVLGIFFLAFFTVVLLLGRKMATNITGPIEQLVTAMKVVEAGEFKTASTLEFKQHANDEAGRLSRHFRSMMKKINELIEENYEKQLMVRESEFKALQAQINPHFLYNTLDSIHWLAKMNQQEQISKMTESLGFLLRNSIHVKKHEVTLEEELDIALHYMTIQRYRFEERLVFSWEVEDDLQHCMIPKLTLQPILENAIQYALEPYTESCSIQIKIWREDDVVWLSVSDNGPGMDETLLDNIDVGRSGIGLFNIHRRLQLTFGSEYGLKIFSQDGVGTTISLRIPYESGRSHV